MYTEDDLLPISALQHLLFCERQCALIHIERVWDENRFTAKGKIMHDRVHDGGQEKRGSVRTEFGVTLRSLALGLIGQADVVEFLREEDTNALIFWQPFPVEYKLGKPKIDDWDRVQVCAQALCLEEMFDTDVPAGAIFYGKIRRREQVVFDENLRKTTVNATARLHDLIAGGCTPSADYKTSCRSCSLITACMPRTAGRQKRVDTYLKRMVDVS